MEYGLFVWFVFACILYRRIMSRFYIVPSCLRMIQRIWGEMKYSVSKLMLHTCHEDMYFAFLFESLTTVLAMHQIQAK